MLKFMGATYRWRRCGGALILELLIGFSLVTVALLAVFSLFPTGERAATLADKSSQALQLASTLLQEELSRNYFALSVGVEEGEEPFQHTLRRGVETTTLYLYKIETSRPHPGLEIYKVAVSVTWEEGSEGKTRDGLVYLEGEKGRLW